MSRSSGDHLKWNEVKEGIIEFVASRSEAVPEPDIRKHLAEKYGITDLKNIKKHLSDLQCQPISCIEKIRPKPGFVNKWEIRRIEHLTKIQLNFPDIQLKKYEKPLKIVIKRFSPRYSNPLLANKLRIQLRLSNSFFDTYVKTDPEIVNNRAYKLYKYSFDKWGKEHLKCKLKVLEDLALGIALDRLKIIVGEAPVGMAEIDQVLKELDREGIENEEEDPLGIALDRLKITLGEVSVRSKINQVWKALDREGIENEESKLMSYLNEWDKSGEAFERNLPMYIGPVLIETMFDHCFERDIADGTDSPEEIEFVNKTKEMRAHYKANSKISLLSQLKEYDDFYVQYFEKIQGENRDSTSLNSL